MSMLSSVHINCPVSLCMCPLTGDLLVGDDSHFHVTRIKFGAEGQVLAVEKVAGNRFGYQDGPAATSKFGGIYGLCVSPMTGSLFAADWNNNRIREIGREGQVTTYAGSGELGSNDGVGTAASFNGPRGNACNSEGVLFVADSGNSLIRKIAPGGVVTTLHGIKFRYPTGLALNTLGSRLFVADREWGCISRVEPADK